MKKFNIFSALLMVSFVSVSAFGATSRGDSARVGFGRPGTGGTRMPTFTVNTINTISKPSMSTNSVGVSASQTAVQQGAEGGSVAEENPQGEGVVKEVSGDCRDAYRNCMDQFCLLDESQGERCACSDNIDLAKSKIQAVLKIQEEADKLFTEGVEREQLGAKARLVFTENSNNTKVSAADFLSWLGADEEDYDEDEGDVGEDVTLGDDLYQMASKYCAAELESCASKAEMETMLYTRMIAQDCKNYDAYLKDQRANAESNKRIAESAVRKARLEMLDTTNKYNRGECLLAYRSCISDKGGCGVNFENCLDAKLLARRSNTCENVLDQCMAVSEYVKQDWAAESKSVLKEAEKYADKYERQTCLARIQDCLEEGCSTTTNSECLTDVNVAAGVCPVITECNAKIPGIQAVVNDKLKYLQTKFCENDIDKCFQDKCGIDFTKAECVGKKPYEIAALCPQDMFPSCNGAKQYDIIVQSVLLQMDYQMLQGCVNYFDTQLSKVCGTDMACLPIVSAVSSLTENNVPRTGAERTALETEITKQAETAVDDFFEQFEKDKTVAECLDSQSVPSRQVQGKRSMGESVFASALLLAKTSAVERNLREMDSKISELKRVANLEDARRECLTTYAPEKPNESNSNYSYIHTVSFESDLHNCHVCRIQRVCATGGLSKEQAAAQYAAGGFGGGAAIGTMLPGTAGLWGTAVGGIIGAAALGYLGYTSGGEKESCQELEACEDININVTGDGSMSSEVRLVTNSSGTRTGTNSSGTRTGISGGSVETSATVSVSNSAAER